MVPKREKVVVAMSGGVDSSVAACLLVEQGYEVMGLFMRAGIEEPLEATERQSDKATKDNADQVGASGTHPTNSAGVDDVGDSVACESSRGLTPAAQEQGRKHQGCCSAGDAADARFVAGLLDIPFYVLNFEKEFDQLIDDFADEYVRGRTPNPCIVCNNELKFGRIVEYADAVGAQFIATGHYARVGNHDGQPVLLRGVDTNKDQSYVLFGLDRALLGRILFPIGELTKPQVRQIAQRFDLPNRDKPDSVEICFAPDRDYARVVRQRRPEAFTEGDVLNQAGEVIGRHQGIAHYTIGQRRGLGIAAGTPIYVIALDAEQNTVTMGGDEALLRATLTAARASFLTEPPGEPFRADVKIRYLHRAAPATVESLGHERVCVTFDEPQRAITPGQAVVFYDGDTVVGGAWIE